MVDEFGRTGRSGGAGFYDYDEDGKRAGLWPGLREHFGKPDADVPFEDMKERMLFSEALDTVRLFEEGVLTSVADANIGSIMGIGFPPWTGGVIQYINGYEGGLPGFVARARELAERYGDRFAPPALLAEKASKGETFKDRDPPAPDVRAAFGSSWRTRPAALPSATAGRRSSAPAPPSAAYGPTATSSAPPAPGPPPAPGTAPTPRP